ncbi:F-box/kelch-repeat protein At2g44130-like [Carica papaya]|uniref:F-box/kelch-repeat protein At2g44130-like n=1 Tax=Carica papaya TaxID=3649 RepID=UPI000B8D0809|nr:F-box/kelch-repeat protein At2g44130-like [Carica papaya]
MTQSPELIPGLPEEIALECLTRLHHLTHRVATQVCSRWRRLIHSKEFYYQRKQTGKTHKTACLIQSLPVHPGSDDLKPVGAPRCSITLFDPVNETWDRIDPIPKYPDGLPLFCQVASSEGKLVVMGGWEPASYQPTNDVFVYDFTNQRWKQGKDMPETRSFFAIGEVEGRVLVAGGHDNNKNALSSAWAYDVSSDEWTELTRMSQERDECAGIVIGGEFWVVGGYRTESQGGFEGSAEFYELRTGEWKRVEEAWKTDRSARSYLGIDKDGKLICWAEKDPRVRDGVCAVQVSDRTVLSGSAYQGGPQGIFVVEGQNGKLKKVEVVDEFCGLVQSGCCVEI